MNHTHARPARIPLVTARAPKARPRCSQIERESRQYNRLVAISLPPFLALAAIARLTGWRWEPWAAAPGGRRSVLKEATEAAKNTIALSHTAW